MITCNQCRDDLAEYALDRADAAQARPLAEHLAACGACRREFEELQAVWTAMPMALAPVEPAGGLFDRVLERIDRGSASDAATSAVRPGGGERILSYLVAATVLIGLTLGFWRLAQPGVDAAAAAAHRNAEKLAERLGNLQQMERLLAAENVRLVSLESGSAPSDAEAYIVWDLAARQWHFYAHRLPTPPAGRAYQVWIVQRGGHCIPGPTFAVNGDGLGSVVVDLPKLDGASRAVVTLEPAEGSQQPTGAVFLEAAL